METNPVQTQQNPAPVQQAPAPVVQQQAPVQRPTPMQIATQRIQQKKRQAAPPQTDKWTGTGAPQEKWVGSANLPQESESGPTNSMFGKSFHAAHELE